MLNIQSLTPYRVQGIVTLFYLREIGTLGTYPHIQYGHQVAFPRLCTKSMAESGTEQRSEILTNLKILIKINHL